MTQSIRNWIKPFLVKTKPNHYQKSEGSGTENLLEGRVRFVRYK
jgi:hypothetical protein